MVLGFAAAAFGGPLDATALVASSSEQRKQAARGRGAGETPGQLDYDARMRHLLAAAAFGGPLDGTRLRALPALLAVTALVRAAAAEPPELTNAAPESLEAPAPRHDLVGQPIVAVEVIFDDPRWAAPIRVQSLGPGQPLSNENVRRALDELAGSGRFGKLWAEGVPHTAGVVLRLHVVARRIVAGMRLTGMEGDPADLLRATGLRPGGEVVADELPAAVDKLRAELARRGYPLARVGVESFDTDDPMAVLLAFEVEAGSAIRVDRVRFLVWPDPRAPRIAALLDGYPVRAGERADLNGVEEADRQLERALRGDGYHGARVEHELRTVAGRRQLDVRVYAGSRFVLRFEGHRRFDAAQLEAALELGEASDRSPDALARRLQSFYVARGFADAVVEPKLSTDPKGVARALVLRVNEGDPLRVVAREYPCLTGERDAAAVGSEIDSFLSDLPGGTLVDAVDPETVDRLYGPRERAGRRATPLYLNPWSVYSPEIYDKAVEHLEDLFRSEGYLSARVGPVTLLRGGCDPRSPPGRCLPARARPSPPAQCPVDAAGVPAELPEAPAELACVRDIARGVRCEPEAVLSIPIRLGPRAFLEGVEFRGNDKIDAELLREAADLDVGAPVSQLEIERARRRLLDLYAEEAFAFADIETELELSPDQRRARVRFAINERRRVRVARIVVRGARITNESLIRSRIALEVGGDYRHSLVRRTEEHLATLGVFSSVNVGFEDPYVPASEKVVVVSIQERKPQYLDVRPGFSTGEGFRITFEYGHRNLGGEAIQLTLRSQLGFLPLELILEDDVRQKYSELKVGERLERRNTVTVELPEIGLGPLFRLRLEGVDVRDNARDFGLTKDAGIATLSFLPSRRLSFQIGGSLERNDALIFGREQKGALNEYILENPSQRNAFRVPEGPTFVIAERVGVAWDRRDNPLDATSGTFVSAGVEHVNARPLGEDADAESTDSGSVFDATKSDFLRYTNRLAAYVRLSERGLALATSFRWGYNQQLYENSRTYPDRLFFLGGIDSLRGFLQDSVVPEDIAERLLDPSSGLAIEQVVIRGGDVFVNPRAELRIPLNDTVETAVFLDAGNLWADPDAVELLRLRYSTGTGLRVATPIGPLVFDYGFNVERVLDTTYPSRRRQRYWESLGAFHFSIGLF